MYNEFIHSSNSLIIFTFQVELALSVEELLPARSRRYFIREKYTITPNIRRLGFFENFRYGLFGSEADRFDSQENISNALHPQPVSCISTLHDDTVFYPALTCNIISESWAFAILSQLMLTKQLYRAVLCTLHSQKSLENIC